MQNDQQIFTSQMQKVLTLLKKLPNRRRNGVGNVARQLQVQTETDQFVATVNRNIGPRPRPEVAEQIGKKVSKPIEQNLQVSVDWSVV